ncbi:hypothetical protein ACQKNX_22670 [Lysinibacillus sp. NPDC093712]|uniref:hypothetical protein n=1 Tax=Lysinibacillus sp. NPDC093712 TaxID=3390579 RepID=UPI003D076FD9
MKVSPNNEFYEFRQFMQETNLSKLSGFDKQVFNERGVEIAITNSPEYAEGLVKSHNHFMRSILLLEEIKNLTDCCLIKSRIEEYLRNCIG